MNKRYLAKLGSPITRPPGDLPKLGGKLHQHGGVHGALTSVRRAMHQGHEIAITTTYTITINGKPFTAHVEVDDLGRVHCHGLPNYNFMSAIDMVKAVIDSEPDSYPKKGRGRQPSTKPTKPTNPTNPTNPSSGGGHDHGGHDHGGGH